MKLTYRTTLRLYPPSFREQFGDDLAELFDDLVADRGRRAAWRICAVDLLVTVPLFHLERIMSQHASTTTLIATIVALAAISIASLITDFFIGVVLLPVAIALGVVQLSRLAQAIRVPDSHLRRRRLRTAAALTAVLAVSYLTFLAVIGDSWTGRDTVIAVAGTLSMIGALVYLVVGLLTPRSPDGVGRVVG